MKNLSKVILLFLPLFLFSELRAQKLQIHQFGLGDGDCALIIVIDSTKGSLFVPSKPDTATVLIDAQRSPGGAPLLATVTAYLNDTLKRKVLDYVVVSHMHFDHYGGMLTVLKGLTNAGISVVNVCDRTALNSDKLVAPDVDDDEDADVCFDYDSIDPAGVRSAAAKAYIKYVKESLGGVKFVDLGSDLLAAKNFKNTSMLCVAAYGACLTASGKGTISGSAFFIPGNSTGTKYKPKSENDLSYCFLLQYGTFRYFTGGDIGGYNQGNYSDGETSIATFLSTYYGASFHVCAMKVSHHGSAHSTNQAFVNVMKPTYAVFPAALKTYGRSTKPLPTEEAIDMIKGSAKNKMEFYTFVPNNSQDPESYYLKGNLKLLQDVSFLIPGIPGTGTINFYVRFQSRNKDDFSYSGNPFTTKISCSQTH